jgi:hypothetical protein
VAQITAGGHRDVFLSSFAKELQGFFNFGSALGNVTLLG